jgi:predicted NACHT family NTPase
VADVPEAADTYSATERRLLLEAEGVSPDQLIETQIHLDSLRAHRWNESIRQGKNQLKRRSIQETLLAGDSQSLVILGDPGSGKTTLLHYLALQTSEAWLSANQIEGEIRRLPVFIPLAAYDEHLRRKNEQVSLKRFPERILFNLANFARLATAISTST